VKVFFTDRSLDLRGSGFFKFLTTVFPGIGGKLTKKT
jgi:hypothetical protein